MLVSVIYGKKIYIFFLFPARKVYLQSQGFETNKTRSDLVQGDFGNAFESVVSVSQRISRRALKDSIEKIENGSILNKLSKIKG